MRVLSFYGRMPGWIPSIFGGPLIWIIMSLSVVDLSKKKGKDATE